MRTPLKAILIDDERASIDALQDLINLLDLPVDIVGTFTNPLEGIEAIHQNPPDLVFLDIKMPKKSGIEVAQEIKKHPLQIIFVTAHDQYAIRALKLSALDYLLKPTDHNELIAAVKKAEKNKIQQDEIKTNAEKIDTLINMLKHFQLQGDRIELTDLTGTTYVKVNDIVYLRAQGNYSDLYLEDHTKLCISKQLGIFESDLASYLFKRSHKSYLVNSQHIKRKVTKDGPYLVMSNGDNVPISSSYRNNF